MKLTKHNIQELKFYGFCSQNNISFISKEGHRLELKRNELMKYNYIEFIFINRSGGLSGGSCISFEEIMIEIKKRINKEVLYNTQLSTN